MRSKSHGEMKRRIADITDADPSRYADGTGTERHRRMTRAELETVCEALGLGMVTDESAQQMRDSLMLKLGRDHRTGVGTFDSSDLAAILGALEGDGDA